MSDNSTTQVVIGGGLFWIGIFSMLIACMHYGYSCNACGCDLIDSRSTQTQGQR